MPTPRILYIVVMFASGLALGILGIRNPAISAGAIPPLMWLLMVSLIVDGGVMYLASRNGSTPLTMNGRIIGFLGAALIYTGIAAAFAPK